MSDKLPTLRALYSLFLPYFTSFSTIFPFSFLLLPCPSVLPLPRFCHLLPFILGFLRDAREGGGGFPTLASPPLINVGSRKHRNLSHRGITTPGGQATHRARQLQHSTTRRVRSCPKKSDRSAKSRRETADLFSPDQERQICFSPSRKDQSGIFG